MKNKILFVLVVTLLLFPLMTFALPDKGNYVSTSLKETLEDAGIELKNVDYEESDKQITVYLFRSSNCQYTKPLLEYFNSISDEYGEYFKLMAFDVAQNSDNMDLYREVVDFLGQEVKGVPFYVIGDKTYLGFSEEAKDEIGRTIKAEYDRFDRYDVFEAMAEQATRPEEKPEEKREFSLLFYVFIFIIIVVVTLLFINIKTGKLNKKLDLLKKGKLNKKPGLSKKEKINKKSGLSKKQKPNKKLDLSKKEKRVSRGK